MNASNHLRCTVSSLARDEKGLVPAIIAKERLQFLLWVLVGCDGQVQGGRHVGANQPVRAL